MKEQAKTTENRGNHAKEMRSEAAKRGWETRREHESARARKMEQPQARGGSHESREVRSEAAKKGWGARRESAK